MDAVARICNDAEVFRHISDDMSPYPYVPDPRHLYIMNKEETGVIQVESLTGTTCMVHLSCLPSMNGNAADFVKEAIAWGFSHTPYTKIVAIIPETNRGAIRVAKQCNFQVEGKITKSFRKNWVHYDQVVLGLSKYETGGEKCHKQQG